MAMEGQNQSVKSREESRGCISRRRTLYGRTPHAYQSLLQRLDPSDSQQDEVRAMSSTKKNFECMGKGLAQAYKVGQPNASRRILFGVPCMMHVTTLPGQLKVWVG